MIDAEIELHEILKELLDQTRRADYRNEAGPLVNNIAYIAAEELIARRERSMAQDN
jgi:hypothetical protein